MKKIICFVLVCFICFPSAIYVCAQETTDNTGKEINLNNIDQEKIDNCINDILKASNVPGASIVIVNGKQTKYLSYGFSNKEQEINATRDTLYELGSMSKAFTALGILLLEQRDQLSLEDPVSKYIPWLRLRFKGLHQEVKINNVVDLKISDLLYHTSGIPFDTIGYIPVGDTDDMLEKTIQTLQDVELDFYPGSRHQYATINYDILALIIQNITGQLYEDFMTQHILKPLGLYNTYMYRNQSEVLQQIAQGYKQGFFRAVPYDAPVYRGNTAAGYVISSASDMRRWMRIQMGLIELSLEFEGIIKKSHTNSIVDKSQYYFYAGGWSVNTVTGEIGHGGSNPTFSSMLSINLNNNLGVCVLTNMNSDAAGTIVYNVLNIITGKDTVPYNNDLYKNTDTLFSCVIIISAVLGLLFSILLIIAIKKLIRKKRAYKKPEWKKGIIAVLVAILAILCLLCYNYPQIAFGLPWVAVGVWGPFTILTGCLIGLTAYFVFFLYSTFVIIFPKKEVNKKSFAGSLENNTYMLKLVFKASPFRVVSEFIVKIMNYFRNIFFSIFVMKYLFNAFEKHISFNEIVNFIIITIAVMTVTFIIAELYSTIYRPVSNQKISRHINMILFEKASQVELACFENTEFFNKYTKAANETNNRAMSILDNITNFTAAIISCIVVMVTLLTIDGIAILWGLLPFVLYYIINKTSAKRRYALYEANIMPNRRMSYASRAAYLKDFSKELRLFDIKKVLLKRYGEAAAKACENYDSHGHKIANIKMLSDLTGTFFTVGALIFASARVLIFRVVSIGNFIVLVNALREFSGLFGGFSGQLTAVIEHSMYSENLIEFLNYKPEIDETQKGKIPDFENACISLKNVSFKYPNHENYVIHDLTIDINPNEKVAFVGHNGVGKTTIIKLLLRLYDPTEGEILLNGINIKEYNLKEYRKLFATVFQDYKVFSVSVYDNVAMCNGDISREEVVDALKRSGIYDKIRELTNGMDTILTREFDDEGAILSGGEIQKIAIARMLVRKNPFAILDEPTSALDPIAEYQMYENMVEAAENKTVIFISHRLSSAVLADKVYMLEHGIICESGTHDELMKKNGKYAEMFKMQAEKYND